MLASEKKIKVKDFHHVQAMPFLSLILLFKCLEALFRHYGTEAQEIEGR